MTDASETEDFRAKITASCPFCGPGELRVGNNASGASWPHRPVQCPQCGIKVMCDWDSPERWNQRFPAGSAAKQDQKWMAALDKIAGFPLCYDPLGRGPHNPTVEGWIADLRARASIVDSTSLAIIVAARVVARGLGWAIGAHGSLARDIDLIAVPWTAEAVPWREFHSELIRELDLVDMEGERLGMRRSAFGRIWAFALQHGAESDQERFNRGEFAGPVNPKGAWDPPAIDLSIIDPRDPVKP